MFLIQCIDVCFNIRCFSFSFFVFGIDYIPSVSSMAKMKILKIGAECKFVNK